ncbi:MAG: 50S ribosomal protein L25 [Fimbriiglobus sp.]
MSETATFAVEPRTEMGSRSAAKLRKRGRIPAVVYGHKETPAHVSLDALEFDRAVRIQHVRTLTITLDGKPETVLIKDLQFDYLGKTMIHADLMRVSASERVEVKVPVELRGAPKATGGGVLEQPLHLLHVECSPMSIPDAFRVDVTDLTLGHPIHVSDLKLPEGVKVLDSAEAVVVQLKLPGQEAVVEAGAVEPVVLTAKKPKDGEEE